MKSYRGTAASTVLGACMCCFHLGCGGGGGVTPATLPPANQSSQPGSPPETAVTIEFNGVNSGYQGVTKESSDGRIENAPN
jgi:hypothetical protein